MILKSLQYLILLLFPCLLAAQDLPTPIVGNLFAKPGIRNGSPGRGLSIEYERHPKFKLFGGAMDGNSNGKNDVEAKERFEAKVKFPLLLKNNWKVLGDFYHSFERYHFDAIDPASEYAFRPIDGTMLRRTRVTGYVFKSMSPKTYLALRVEASSNGKYKGIANFDRRYMVYRASAVLGIVGAGGIGFELMAALRLIKYDEVSALLLSVLACVLVVDGMGAALRRKLK